MEGRLYITLVCGFFSVLQSLDLGQSCSQLMVLQLLIADGHTWAVFPAGIAADSPLHRLQKCKIKGMYYIG